MRELFRVPYFRVVSFLALAVKDLKIIYFSSKPVIVEYEGRDGKRFFVANNLGEKPLANMNGGQYFVLQLERSPLRRIVRRVKSGKTDFIYLADVRSDDKVLLIRPATVRLWLAMLWRAKFLI